MYMEERTRAGELRVKQLLRALNPADMMAKFIDYATVEKRFEKLGRVDLECRSDTQVGYRHDD